MFLNIPSQKKYIQGVKKLSLLHGSNTETHKMYTKCIENCFFTKTSQIVLLGVRLPT